MHNNFLGNEIFYIKLNKKNNMSAITGILYRDGRSVSIEQIKKMNDTLLHRGVDGSQVWSNGTVAFGHQMLHTTPESLTEQLPFKDPDSDLIITADARIDNRTELSALLGLKDVKTIPDSLFILKAYQNWGEKCPEHLLGDFAFAIWDHRNEKLFCARDHMGVKPFYYHLSNNLFAFSTEIKALFTIPEIKININDVKVALHIMNAIEKNLTFYEDIFSLTAANSISVKKNEYQINRYWKLDPYSQITMDSDEDYVTKFLDIFNESVKCRLRSSFPIGFELSGGLDSSSIVTVAKRNLNTLNLNTFSIIFNEFPDCDESYFIKKIIDNGGIKPHFVYGDKISPLAQVDTILWHLEQPFFNPNTAILWNLYEKMHKNDIRVILSGHDGDSVISYGQNYLRDLAANFKWIKLIKELRETSKVTENTFLNIFLSQVLFPIMPHLRKMIAPRGMRKKPGSFVLNDDFKEKIQSDHYLNELYYKPVKKANTSKKFHEYLISTFPHQYVMEFVDRSLAAFSIEPRFPFFDKRLVEFCYALPTEMKFKNGWMRYILRIAMEGYLPKENQWRVIKPDLNPVFQKNLLRYEKERVKKLLSNKALSPYVDFNKMGIALKNYESKSQKHNLHSDSFDVWYTTIISLWLEKINKIKDDQY